MTSLLNALVVEGMKARRTLAALFAGLAPGVVGVLRFIEWWHRGGPATAGSSAELWHSFALSCLVLWSMLMLPFVAALEGALLVDMEERSGGWKHLFSLPVERWKTVGAKAVVLHALMGVSHVCLAAWIVGFGVALSWLSPEISMGGPAPWPFLIETIAMTFAASVLLTSLHFWFSLRTRNVVAALAIALGLIFLGLVVTNTEFGRYYPWSLPVNVVFGTGERTLSSILTSLSAGALVSVLAVVDFSRRDVPK